MKKKILFVIPARGGSKGIPGKNIKPMGGIPLICRSIDIARKFVDDKDICVTTDSDEIIEVAKQHGMEVPFKRPDYLATDTASSLDVIEEVLHGYKKLGHVFDTFCILQPTSPLRTHDDIRAAYDLYNERASFAVISVCEAEHSPLWCGKLPENHEFVNFITPSANKRRQDTDTFYRLNGAIYIINAEKFEVDKFFYHAGSFAYVMPQERSIDIDSKIDFLLAQIILGGN